MSEQEWPQTPAPVTGNAEVDRALASLAGLGERPVAEHQERLGAVQDVLAAQLEASRHAVASPIPQALRPRTQHD